MSLHKFAEQVAANGRGEDSLLVHMTPDEVRNLQKFAQANGTTLTINPETGLPEAGLLSDLFKAVAPIALGAFLGPAGLGMSSMMAGVATGGITALATGSLSRGFMAGLGAYGGAGLGESFMNAGTGALSSAAGAGLGEEAAQQAVASKLASATPMETLSAGFNAATASPAAMGTFAKNNLSNLGYVAAPLMAMQPTTKMPDQKDTGYIRQYDYNINPNTGRPDPTYGMRAMPLVKASEFKDKTFEGQRERFRQENPYDTGVASLRQQPTTAATGGIVALADGGILGDFGVNQISQEVKNQSPTFNSVEDLYTNILGRPSDAGGAEFWKQQFGDTIDPSEINAFTQSANVELANRTPAQQQALAPNLVGYPPTGYKREDALTMPVMDGGNPPPYSMGEDGRGLPPDKITYGETYQGIPDPTNPVILRGNQNLPIAQQPMSAAASTAGAATTNAGVEELYRSILGRAPDAGGLDYWSKQFGDTVDASERAAFTQAARPEQQVADMYRNVLGRDPDPGGLQYWTTRINAGESPSNVYNEFLASARENTELVTADQIKNATFEQATTPYTGYRSTDQVNIVDEWVRNTLGREPTAADKEQTWYKDAFNTMKTAPDAKNLYNQFIDYAKTDAAATTAQKIKDVTASLTARGITEADVLRQTGKTIAQLAASDIDFTKNLVGASQLRAPGTKAGFDFSSIRKPTTPKTNAPVGTTNPYGNATNPGDITRNADGSTTVTPNIPGRPFGGFSGMEQVRNAYTDGGGSLGYTSKAPKTMEEFNQLYNKQTGDSKAAYDYLMGKAAYPTKTTASEVAKPYAEATLGVAPNISLSKMLFDPVTKTYKPNPDYTPISYTKEGKRVVGLSDREVKDKLSSETTTTKATGGLLNLANGGLLNFASGGSAADTKAYEQWLRTNNVSIEQVARALGISVAEAKKRYNLESDAKGGSGAVDLGGGEVPTLSPQTLDFLSKETPYDNEGRMTSFDKGLSTIAGFLPVAGFVNQLPTYLSSPIVGAIANMFGGKNPNPESIPVESRGGNLTPAALASQQAGLAVAAENEDVAANAAQAAQAAQAAAQQSAIAAGYGNESYDDPGEAVAADAEAAATASGNPSPDDEGLARGGLMALAQGGTAKDNTAASEQWLRTNNVTIEQVARALGISVSEAKKQYNLESDAKDTSGFKGYAGFGESGKDFSNEKPSDFIENEGLVAQGERNQQTNDFLTDLSKAVTSVVPGLSLPSFLGNFFGTQPPAPVESRGTAAVTEAKEQAERDYSYDVDAMNNAEIGKGEKNAVDAATYGFDASTPGTTAGALGDNEARGGLNLNGKYYPPKYAQGGLSALAQGGMFNLGGYSDGGRLLRGPGDGVSDSIPAMIGKKQPARLADGEFVVPARIVSELGNGSTEAGARKLYAMMERVQRARSKTTGKNKVAANSRSDKYLPA